MQAKPPVIPVAPPFGNPNGPSVKASTPPPAEARVNDGLVDEWIIIGKRVIRQFRKPRLVTFTPHNTGCPVDPNRLKARRVTHCINVETGEIVECEDDWKTCQRPYFNPLDSGERWTGWTEFEIEDEEVNEPMGQQEDGSKMVFEDGSKKAPKRKAEDEGDDERAKREELLYRKLESKERMRS